MAVLSNRYSYIVPKYINGIFYGRTVVLEDETRWIIAQRDNYALAISDGLLEVSVDGSVTWSNSLVYDTSKIINAYIFRNGNIFFTTTDNKIFLTNYNLVEPVEKTMYDLDGVTPYTIHTPANADYAGRYFYTHKYMSDTTATDMLVFGNYCNVNLGACPVAIYCTEDFGVTFKVIYKFGQNPAYRDNGTSTGSSSTGTLLGDASNPIVTRHIHGVEYNEDGGYFVSFTGDSNKTSPVADEIHWMKHTPPSGETGWVHEEYDFGAPIEQTSRLKVGEGFFYNNYLYYGSDNTGATDGTQNGLWRVYADDIEDLNLHVRLIKPDNPKDVYSCVKLDKNTNNILITAANYDDVDVKIRYLIISENLGLGNRQTHEFTGADFIRLSSPSSLGFFRLDWSKFAVLKGRSFLIKAGDNLFNNI